MPYDFYTHEWTAALDQTVEELLDAVNFTTPPVDAIKLALQLKIEVVLDESQQPRGRRTRVVGRDAILIRPEERPERTQWSVAHELGETYAHRVFRNLTANLRDIPLHQREEVANRFASHLLLPSRWFLPAARHRDGDLIELKRVFYTVSHELIAWRLLDLPVPTMITLFDQGLLSRRRGNTSRKPPRMQPIEHWCWQQAREFRKPCRAQHAGLHVQAWPIYEVGWQREFLRTTCEYDTEESPSEWSDD